MIFVHIQTLALSKKMILPIKISLKSDTTSIELVSYLIRPRVSISKAIYAKNNIDRLKILNAPSFCDIADELIEMFQNQHLVFSDARQFKFLKSEFKIIGYNFQIKPLIIWNNYDLKKLNSLGVKLPNLNPFHDSYSNIYLDEMISFFRRKQEIINYDKSYVDISNSRNLSQYKLAPGVYQFLDATGNVIYVGKAKSIRKRLQSHFSESRTNSKIDYSKIDDISITYTGNDFIAQLIESELIKKLKPKYNTQQINTSAPFIISRDITAKGVFKLQIKRKDYEDSISEKYFNRNSVKNALKWFCKLNDLCRKHCGIETIKGPCSKVILENKSCVCNKSETIEDYNLRFDTALREFEKFKTRTIYKLKGRNRNEDAFLYTVNDIYQGYGFIEKSVVINNENDILGYLVPQKNNYDTSRILDSLRKSINIENVVTLN